MNNKKTHPPGFTSNPLPVASDVFDETLRDELYN
jgi:hypothetical protein